MNHRCFGKALLLIFSIINLSCSEQSHRMDIPEESKKYDTLDFIALGDSYTIGQSVSPSESWPYQLKREMEHHGFVIGETMVIAQTGWTTGSLLDAIENTDLTGLRDQRMVSLLIGVNNQYQQLPFETFQEEFDLLLEQSIAIAGGNKKVFVVSLPDYGVTSFGMNISSTISDEIDVYNAYIKMRCDESDIPLINITDISRELANAENALSSDRLHPAAYQYERWVGVMLPVVLALVLQ